MVPVWPVSSPASNVSDTICRAVEPRAKVQAEPGATRVT